jgi:hypothetical protein
VTEAEWLVSADPRAVIRQAGELTQRQATLFACFCCRHIWDLLTNERSRSAVEIAEAFAEGQASESEVEGAYAKLHRVREEDSRRKRPVGSPHTAEMAALRASMTVIYCTLGPSRVQTPPNHLALNVVLNACIASAWSIVLGPEEQLAEDAESTTLLPSRRAAYDATRAVLLTAFRDIVRNPFRPKPDLEPAIVCWNAGTVPTLAKVIYDQRRFSDLPILADALEEGGCDLAEVLNHCRQPGDHVRGCWVLDLILGRA